MNYSLVLIDNPAPYVRRVTLNRPEKRNALNATLRNEVSHALRAGDLDDDVRVTIVRGAGKCFSAGYDLAAGAEEYGMVGTGEAAFQRTVVDMWTGIWDLDKPVIAQVHGHCLAGGSELATGCDLVYVADDAKIGYPAVRFGTPDMQYHAWMMGLRKGMEVMLTGDAISGVDAAASGWANRAYPAEELEARTLEMAQRVAKIRSDVLQINKRTVHRAMEHMGMRQALRAGTEMSGLAVHTEGFKAFIASVTEQGLTKALSARDETFGDGRTVESR
ncbi:enoyl-CoA hydratase-related protein [Streptomyces albipurpureus]|uniref:Enoyl-CoA hydratase-related protein n=1 Tax=Streptomyces albipurpureus TaxID=2897419 RepID=A0ABT0UMG3_9ACTN|nr:enoyl-CoA hydratase-related protein [Streptomyces sp. CWNU-1]MCM2389640.1 enoyl-CoA hydratase-related protein [Streptomyces sp. CWNU-1]